MQAAFQEVQGTQVAILLAAIAIVAFWRTILKCMGHAGSDRDHSGVRLRRGRGLAEHAPPHRRLSNGLPIG
jgi:hypothetical protein